MPDKRVPAKRAPDKGAPTKIAPTLVQVLLTVPAVILLFLYIRDQITYGQVLHWTGQLSAGLLVCAISVSPLRRVVHHHWIAQLARLRRAIGVASWGYAAMHTGAYLEYKWAANLILNESSRWDMATGWLGFAVLTALALTSNEAAIGWLGARWRQLHQLVFLAALLVFLHWLLSSFEPALAVVSFSLAMLVQTLRLRKRL